MSEEKCFCGRDKGHRGRHVGSPAKKAVAPTKAVGSGKESHTPISAALKALREQRDKLDAAIKVLEGL